MVKGTSTRRKWLYQEIWVVPPCGRGQLCGLLRLLLQLLQGG